MELLTLEFTATPKKSKEKQSSIESYFKKVVNLPLSIFFVELIHIYPIMFPANSKPRRPGALVQASHHRQGGHGTVAAAAVGLRGRRHAKGAVVAL